MCKKTDRLNVGLYIRIFCTVAMILLVVSTATVKIAKGQSIMPEANSDAWNLVSSPVSDDLKSVDMTSATNGWAVGNNGTILHWNGATWEKVNSPTTKPIYSVQMITASNGWAVGESGVILHWQGNEWKLVTSPTNSNLYSVDFLSANEGWAVGFQSPGGYKRYGTILKWDGSTWSENISLENNFGFRVIEAITSDSVWVFGVYQQSNWPNPETHTAVLFSSHWDGHLWNGLVKDRCNNWINSIAIAQDNTGWAVGPGGCILPYNGDWGNPVSGIPTNRLLVSIEKVAADNAWVVGGDNAIASQSKSIILHWNGNTWDEVTNPGEKMLSSVSMASAYDGFAVGYGGTILQYTNSAGHPTYPYSILLPLVER